MVFGAGRGYARAMASETTLQREHESAHLPSLNDPRRPADEGHTSGGVVGNERLTAITGTALLTGLAVVGVTILRIGSLLTMHMFVGALLCGPLCLKLASTGYRFGSYYSGRQTYRRAGAPALHFRLLAPAVVLSTLVLFGSGGLMLILGPSSRATLVPIHETSFYVWIACVALHVLGHLPKVGRLLHAEAKGRPRHTRTGRPRRLLGVTVALAAGVALAVLLLPDISRINHAAHPTPGPGPQHTAPHARPAGPLA